MKRATFGFLLFLTGALAVLTAEASHGTALADEVPSPVAQREPAAPPDTEPVADAHAITCPEGMVEVEGEYCPSLEQKCLRWADSTRCAEFAPTGACPMATVHQHFCIDRYEFPNREGAKPVVMKTWEEAQEACGAVGKRLCGDTEWTLACEGEEHLAYPYGNTRDAEACNIDKPHRDANLDAYNNPSTRGAEGERLWQGEPSGARAACESAYGVRDMTGNVDEWVVNQAGAPHRSGLKGGHWGPVRNRCRPMTTGHDEQFSFYQIGFRCCGDAQP